jgi:hypothetical protein
MRAKDAAATAAASADDILGQILHLKIRNQLLLGLGPSRLKLALLTQHKPPGSVGGPERTAMRAS